METLLYIVRVLGANGLTCPNGHGEVSIYLLGEKSKEPKRWPHQIGYCWVCERQFWLDGKWKGKFSSLYGGIPFPMEDK